MEPLLLFLLLLLLLLLLPTHSSDDAASLLALKSSIDPSDALPWRRIAAPLCAWSGVKNCSPDGHRVTKLVLETLNLTGVISYNSLAPLDQLRVLSLKDNNLSGPIPDLSALLNLKSLYLAGNRFSGEVPASLAGLHRLKVVALDDNHLTGPIPPAFTSAARLYVLLLQDNRLSGPVPAFNQPGLLFFNVSGNDLSGEIPGVLVRFGADSFLDNANLCGAPLTRQCQNNNTNSNILPAPVMSPPPTVPVPMTPATSPSLKPSSNDLAIHAPAPAARGKSVVKIAAGAAGGAAVLLVGLSAVVVLLVCRRRQTRREPPRVEKSVGDETVSMSAMGGGAASGGSGGGVKWETVAEEEGKLEFCGGAGEMFGLEDLLRASAEMLGRGTVGSTYKAVMENGFIVTVKRLTEDGGGTPLPAAAMAGSAKEFGGRMEELGRLRHPNLVPLRAYFQAKEERLIVYDYFPNGSLFTLIHGSRLSGSGKPLHWTSCLKIAEDVAAGLLYLHQSGAVHGNLKSSNVLLGSDFESCLTDYGLLPYLLPAVDTPSTTYNNHHRAPESRHPQKPLFTPASDVYSFGTLLLKLLTGKDPSLDFIDRHSGASITRWVRSVRENESAESGGEDPTADEKLAALLGIAAVCVAASPEERPATREVLRLVREARVEAMVSSNSSDHSPGRWSDTMQGLHSENYGVSDHH